MGHPIICGVGQGVEDHGDSLAEIHGEVPVGCAGVHGNGEECVAVAELVVREACFLRAEEDCDAGGGVAGEFCVDGLRGFAEELERVFQDRGGWIRWAGGEGVHTTGWEGRRDGGGWIRWGGSR